MSVSDYLLATPSRRSPARSRNLREDPPPRRRRRRQDASVRGHIVLYSRTLSGTVTSRSQSLAILGPDHCQRHRSTPAKVLLIPLLLLFSLLLCIITQVIVE
ncbi:hypothetical protein EYF80_048999 [Liparis tanakae]|uniref:Uncharacterized protein n=1 Tax=Liparis tanakae TaxID=230148 RepID=A0A4Z2FHY1_9TELE|nr:hypothetical protein EYF80_048999 [Liparis tanakae]